MALSSVVIKVKYGDTLRRFNALINEEQHLDLDMERLRTKICSLFNFTPDADFNLTYIDEDNDQVTLAEDEDLYDVVRQGLNPVRMTVHLNVDKSSGKSAGSSTPKGSSSQSPHRNLNPRVTEILKSVPEPLCDALSKLSLELASKAATTPVLADLINNLSKVGQSYLNASPSPSGTSSVSNHELNDDHKNASAREKHGASTDEGMKPDGIHVSTSEQSAPMSSQVPVPHAVKGARPTKFRSPQHPCFLLHKGKNPKSGHFRYMPMGDGIKKDKEIVDDSDGNFENNVNSTKLPTCDSRKKDKGIKGDSAGSSVASGVEYAKAWQQKQVEAQKVLLEKNVFSKKGTNEASPGENEQYNLGSFTVSECPFSGVPLQPTPGQGCMPPPIVPPFNRSFNNSAVGIGSIFHTGVRCDGCGVLPITGPRFKSKVKHDYDLCSICFSRTGNDADYARMDFPLPYRHPWTFKGFHDPMFGHLPSMQVPSMMTPHGAKHLRSRLDSRFIMDVNVLDGTLMAPSTPFTKIWRMRNNGTLPWARGLQLIWIGGDRFNASDSVEIEIPAEGVNVGNEIDIAVDFIAPELPGRYISYWRMAHPTGHKFGQRVWVLIQVDAALGDSTHDSSPVLKSGQPSPVNAGISAHESSPVMDLNLPPGNAGSFAGESSRVEDLNLDANVDEPTGDVEAGGDLSSAPETTPQPSVDPVSDLRAAQKEAISLMIEHHKRRVEMEEVNFPINNDLLVASNGSSSSITSPFSAVTPEFPVESPISYPEIDASLQQKLASDISSPITTASSSSSTLPPFYSADRPTTFPMSSPFLFPVIDANVQPSKPASASPSVSYPIIDMNGESSITSPSAAANYDDDGKRESDQVRRENEVEETLLKELEAMGFEQVDLNKEVLRANEYDLERSVDDLCGVVGWDPILEELKEMGFEDKETNKKLLVKNNGSLTRVVMDLITGEKEA